jgi:hypothetical protein
MEQLSSHGADILETVYWGVSKKSVEKIQDYLTSDKNNGYFL